MTTRHRLLSADFPARLRGARERAGLTQAQLGQAAGYSDRQAISYIESGKGGVTTEAAARLAGALGVSPVWLAYGLEVKGGDWRGYGARLREARDAAGLSCAALAPHLGYRTRAAVTHLEVERGALDLALAEHAARALGVSPAWLAFGVEG